jgi:pyrroline-5-carboxylate reductase
MNLGFIGTGQIAKATILGILGSNLKINKIYISQRNKKTSSQLSKKSKKIIVLKNNQEIINNSNWIFLSITPEVGSKILKNLKFKSSQTIINFISTIGIAQLKKYIKVKSKIVRALPLPPIALRKGPVPICPANKKVKKFFNHLGTAVEVSNEKLFTNFWCMTAMMAPFYENLNTLSGWLSNKGLNKIDAQRYVTSLFFAMSEDAVANSKKDLRVLIKNSQTPGGLNEQALKQLRRSGFYRLLNNAANSILKRLNKV